MFIFEIESLIMKVDSKDSEEIGVIYLDGPEEMAKKLIEYLFQSTGPFALPVLDDKGRARPADIAFALDQSDYSWELIQGVILEYPSPPFGARF